MFKFFRKYQGWLLAVGFTLLMIVFLLTSIVPNASSMFARDPGSEAIGYINGNQKITRREVGDAGADVEVLRQMPFLPTDEVSGRATDKQDSNLRWALMLREARSLGLDTSNAQITQLIQTVPDMKDEEKLNEFARRLHTTPAGIRKAVGDWIIVHNYRGLVMGREYVNPVNAMTYYYQALLLQLQFRQRAEQFGLSPEMAAMLMGNVVEQTRILVSMAEGAPRVSEPMAKRVLADIDAALPGQGRMVELGSRVTAGAIVVKADPGTATRPSDAAMQDLFNQYKDNLPGTSEPFHLGYRFPDRVKIEFVEVPYEKVKAAVRVREDEAMQYYDEHRDEFPPIPEPEPEVTTTNPSSRPAATTRPAPKPQRYEDVADRVRAQLLEVKAQDLAGRIVKDLKARLELGLPATGTTGFRDLKEFHSPALATEAAKVQDENKVPITVVRKDASWLTAKDLAELPGIARSMIDAGPESRIAARFVDYVLSAHELKPKDDNPLLSYYLQAGVPSAVLINPMTRDRYLFRLIEAEPEHSPASLADVAADVDRDARRLESYRRLKDELPTWIERARKSFEDTGKMQGVTVAPPATFPRRTLSPAGNVEPPQVDGVGRSAAYVDAVFDQADQISDSKPEKVKDLPAEKRIGGVAMDGELAIAVYRIDTYKPISISEYTRAIEIAPALVAALARPNETPLSLDAIEKRLKWVPEKTETQQP